MLLSLFVAATLTSPQPITIAVDRPRYFFILFGGQSLPFRPRTAHTWATFVKVSPSEDGKGAIESMTISWLPDSGIVKPWRLFPEAGRNYSLAETFAIAEEERARVSMWGPFEIDAGWYERAREQVRRLESGAVRYRVLDSFGFNQRVQHCVRAVTATDNVREFRIQPVIQVGEPGTGRLAARYMKRGLFTRGAATHDWVVPAIGADQFPVVQRAAGEHVRRHWRG